MSILAPIGDPMRTGWTQPRNRIAKIVIDAINGQEFEQAPSIEQLEPRVLLSANPLSDILKPNEQAYTIQAHSSDTTDALSKTRSLYSAPSSSYTLPNSSHLNSTIDIDLAILSGSNTVKEWGMNLIDRETGALVASVASGSSAGNFKVAFDTTLFEDGQYYLQVTVRDETGRGSNSNRQITLDNTAPVANISSPSYDAEVQLSFRKDDIPWHTMFFFRQRQRKYIYKYYIFSIPIPPIDIKVYLFF